MSTCTSGSGLKRNRDLEESSPSSPAVDKKRKQDSLPVASIFSKSKATKATSFWLESGRIPDPVPDRHDGAYSGVLVGIHRDALAACLLNNGDVKSNSHADAQSQSQSHSHSGGDLKGVEHQITEDGHQKVEGQEGEKVDLPQRESNDRHVQEGNQHEDAFQKIKVLALDLDGTLIRPKKGKKFPSATDPTDFELINPTQTIKNFKQAHESNHVILILTNQKQTPSPSSSSSSSKSKSKSEAKEVEPSKKLKTWKTKVNDLVQVWDVPLVLIAALNDDRFRKPRVGMWEIFKALLREKLVDSKIQGSAHGEGGSVQQAEGEETSANADRKRFEIDDLIDWDNSIFVGDAAGRSEGELDGKKIEKDWSDTDRKFALNSGLIFKEPEEFFLGQETRPFKLSGWKPTLQDDPPPPIPSEQEILNPSGGDPIPLEVVLFIGPPASGKSSLYRRCFEKQGYVWVNQDQLKTKAKCLSLVEKSLKEGRSCVVDNTNRDEATRKDYRLQAKAHKASIRCIFFDLKRERCEHNARFRAWGSDLTEPSLPLIPGIAYSTFYANLEPPPISEDGKEERKWGYDDRTIRIDWRWEDQDELDKDGNLSARDREKRERYLRWYS